MTRLSTSRPSSSVPNGWAPVGDWNAGKSWARGLYGAMRGANTAMSSHATAITAPTTASGCRHAGRVVRAAARRSEAETAISLT